MIKTITSPTNPLIQHIVKLHNAKYRKTYKKFVAEGLRVISTLIKAQYEPVIVVTTETQLSHIQEIVLDDNIVLVSELIMKKISSLESPSGIIAVFTIPEQKSLQELTSGIVLMNVQNPGNAGTLIRTAVAMGKKTAIFIESVDSWNPKVIQASAGAIGLINIFQLTWQQLLDHKKSLSLCALVVSGGKKAESSNLRNSLIVIGNEGSGLSAESIEQCDEKITLNMPGDFESLNASIAGSIALYLSATHI